MTTVFVTGTFDILHVEHVRFLAAAKNQGKGTRVKGQGNTETRLVVGIESDARIRRLKGDRRPIMPETDRKEMLEALSMVDEVFVLPEQFDTQDAYEKALHDAQADIYAVSEGSPYFENKKKLCEKAGVKLAVVHEHNPKYSTSKLIEKVRTKGST